MLPWVSSLTFFLFPPMWCTSPSTCVPWALYLHLPTLPRFILLECVCVGVVYILHFEDILSCWRIALRRAYALVSPLPVIALTLYTQHILLISSSPGSLPSSLNETAAFLCWITGMLQHLCFWATSSCIQAYSYHLSQGSVPALLRRPTIQWLNETWTSQR